MSLYCMHQSSVSRSVVRGPVPVLRKYKNNLMILLISLNNHERGKTLLDVV
jgi:hypothetical protein